MNISDLPYMMLRCLLLTIIIELIVALIIGIRNKRDILIVILVNVLTNPIVVLVSTIVYNKFGYAPRVVIIAILEACALISEGYIYKRKLVFKKINPFVISLILNLSSYTIGEIFNTL